MELASFSPPFVGWLQADGSSQFGPLSGAPPLWLYADTLEFTPAGTIGRLNSPVAYTIP